MNTCFGPSFASQRVPTYDVKCPNKNPGHWVPNELPADISHMLSQLIAGGIKHILCGLLEEDPWKLAPCFPQTSSHVPFGFADFIISFHCNKSQWVQFYAQSYESSSWLIRSEVVSSTHDTPITVSILMLISICQYLWKAFWDFDKDCIESVYQFGDIAILILSSDPWTWMSFHLSRSSLISFSNDL